MARVRLPPVRLAGLCELEASPRRPGAEPEEPEPAGVDPFVLKEHKRFVLKPMSTQEAGLQMELLGHNFFLFHDADIDEIALLYRRNDGDYGLILRETR